MDCAGQGMRYLRKLCSHSVYYAMGLGGIVASASVLGATTLIQNDDTIARLLHWESKLWAGYFRHGETLP